MNTEQKFKVMFGENKIINGFCYGKGVYELSAEKASAAIKEGGFMSEEDKRNLQNFYQSQPIEGAPLSLEETLERFQNFDFSDDVMRSMQYHQAAIQDKANAANPAMYGDKKPVEPATKKVEDEPKTGSPVSGGIPSGNPSEVKIETAKEKNNDSEQVESDLPEDFPSRQDLINQGITTLAKLRSMKRADILALEKIGDAKANQIGARLAAMAEENK